MRQLWHDFTRHSFLLLLVLLTGIAAFNLWQLHDRQITAADAPQYTDGEALFAQYRRQGSQAYARGEYALAQTAFQQALSLAMTQNEQAVTHIDLAHCAQAQGKAEAAERHFRAALQSLHPQSPDAEAVRGHLAWLQGDLVAAVAAFETALTRDPQNFLASNALGDLYLGDATQPVWDYRRAAVFNRIAAESVVAQQNLALTHFRLGEYAAAQELYDQIARADPANAEALFMLGMIDLLQFEDIPRALARLEQAAELDPRYRPALQQIIIHQESAEPLAYSR